MKIILSPLALQNLERISDFIARDKPGAAADWLDSVFEKVDLLKTNPEMGRVVPEAGVSSIREIIFGNYRVIYRIMEHSLTILTVRNFRQLLRAKDVK